MLLCLEKCFDEAETEREWGRVRGKKWKFHTKDLMQAQKASVASNIVPCIQALYLPQRILRVKLSHARKHWTRFYICAKYCVVFRISSNANNKNITIISIIIHILHGCASASNDINSKKASYTINFWAEFLRTTATTAKSIAALFLLFLFQRNY